MSKNFEFEIVNEKPLKQPWIRLGGTREYVTAPTIAGLVASLVEGYDTPGTLTEDVLLYHRKKAACEIAASIENTASLIDLKAQFGYEEFEIPIFAIDRAENPSPGHWIFKDLEINCFSDMTFLASLTRIK